MNRLLTTTAFAAVLATGAADQQDIMVPQGFSDVDAMSRLSFDDLNGATIHGADGGTLGEITDMIFDSGALGETEGGVTAPDAAVDAAMTTDTGTDTGTATATDTTTDTGTEGSTDATATATDSGTDSGVTETDPMVDGVDTEADAANTDPDATVGDTTTDDTAAGATTGDTTGGDTATGDATDNMMTDEVDADAAAGDIATEGTATEAGADTAMEADTGAAGETPDLAATDTATTHGESMGRATHVVLDIGGFPGIGGHTVAIPIEALEICADAGDNLQVYLPWTEEQLRALPAHDENDPRRRAP